jgi:hypothetical protein
MVALAVLFRSGLNSTVDWMMQKAIKLFFGSQEKEESGDASLFQAEELFEFGFGEDGDA